MSDLYNSLPITLLRPAILGATCCRRTLRRHSVARDHLWPAAVARATSCATQAPFGVSTLPITLTSSHNSTNPTYSTRLEPTAAARSATSSLPTAPPTTASPFHSLPSLDPVRPLKSRPPSPPFITASIQNLSVASHATAHASAHTGAAHNHNQGNAIGEHPVSGYAAGPTGRQINERGGGGGGSSATAHATRQVAARGSGGSYGSSSTGVVARMGHQAGGGRGDTDRSPDGGGGRGGAGRGAGGRGRSTGGRGGGGSGDPQRPPRTLADHVKACKSLADLVALYDTAQRRVAEAAEGERDGGGGGGLGMDGGGDGGSALPPGAVWVFLAGAMERVATWRRRWQAGWRGRKGREALRMRAQLSGLLSESCGVVLWAERLSPSKACLLLSLLVAAGRYPEAEQHLRLLGEDSLNSLDAYSSSQVALAASCFARLRYHPGQGWLDTLMEVTTGQLSQWRSSDLAFLLWALAKWKAVPPAAWFSEYFTALEGCGESVCERDLSLVCWSLGVLAGRGRGMRPPPSTTAYLMLEVQVRLPSLSPQALAHVGWGLCCCDVKPPGFWLQEFYAAAETALPNATHGLTASNLLWATAAWQGQLHPGQSWLNTAVDKSARWLPSLDSRSLAVLLLSLSDLGATPPGPWVSLALEQAHRHLPHIDPPAAVGVLWAVSRFERQRAAAAAAAAAGDPTAPPPPRRRRLSGCTLDEVLLLADDLGLGLAGGPGGSDTPQQLRPPRKWLVRYVPLLQDLAFAAAGVVPPPSSPPAPTATTTTAAATAPVSGQLPLAPASIPPVAVRVAGGGGGLVGGSPAGSGAGSGAGAGGSHVMALGGFTFEGLDANQMLDLVVALADLYVYPGDAWMAAHEARMAALSGGARGGVVGAGRRGGGRGGVRSEGLTPYQWRLLMAAYSALDDTWEGYSLPRAGEVY